MATTITSFTALKGNKTFFVRGTVGTDEALVFENFEGIARVRVLNNDQTAANSVAIKIDDADFAVSEGYVVYGGTAINNGVEFFLYPGEKLYAVAGADRDVTFVAWPNCNQG